MHIYSSDFGAISAPGRTSRRLRKLNTRKLKKWFKARLAAVFNP